MGDRVEVATRAVASTFRYALGRSSHVVRRHDRLGAEHVGVLTRRGWHELVAEEIQQRAHLYQRLAWQKLADHVAPRMREGARRG